MMMRRISTTIINNNNNNKRFPIYMIILVCVSCFLLIQTILYIAATPNDIDNNQTQQECKWNCCEQRKVTNDMFLTQEEQLQQQQSFVIEIKLLAYNRINAIRRCLMALEAAEYGTDNVELTVFLDHFSLNSDMDNNEKKKKLDLQHRILEMVSSFKWSHGKMHIHYRANNANLQMQWLEAFYPLDNDTYAFIVEDDIQVSPFYYMYLKKLIRKYRYSSDIDPNMYGISLQRQHLVPGYKSGKKVEVNNNHQPYLYQLVGTWGQVVFPEHWREFRMYFDSRRPYSELKPRIGGLITDYWYEQKGEKIWTPWFIRFVYSKSYYCLYTNFPGGKSLSASHRDVGENYNIFHRIFGSSGMDAPLLNYKEDMELWKHEYTKELIDAKQLQKFDYCFQEVPKENLIDLSSDKQLSSLIALNQNYMILFVQSDRQYIKNQLCYMEQHASRSLEREFRQSVLFVSDDIDQSQEIAYRGYKIIFNSDHAPLDQVIGIISSRVSPHSLLFISNMEGKLLTNNPVQTRARSTSLLVGSNSISGPANLIQQASQQQTWTNIQDIVQAMKHNPNAKSKAEDYRSITFIPDLWKSAVISKDDLACKNIQCWR
jgi:hypothetical protein